MKWKMSGNNIFKKINKIIYPNIYNSKLKSVAFKNTSRISKWNRNRNVNIYQIDNNWTYVY